MMAHRHDVHYRPAGADDAPAVAALHADSWRRHYRGAYSDSYLDGDVVADRVEVWTARLRAADDDTCTWIAEDAGGLVGFVHMVLRADERWGALVDNLHVTTATHGVGIGTRLLSLSAGSLLERAPSSGLFLWVLEQNRAAQRFYRARSARCVERAPVQPPGGDPTRLDGSPARLRYVWSDPAVLLRPPTGGEAVRVGDPFSPERIRAAYDAVGPDYSSAFDGDLQRLPLDRRMLDAARRAAGRGLILDLGCGTGSAGSYLSAAGARVVGLDLSLGMLRARHPAHRWPVCQGDMRHLPFGGDTFAAVVAYYCMQHLRRPEVGTVLAEVGRVLEPRGTFLLATHLGRGEVFIDEFLGHRVATAGGTLYAPGEMEEELSSAGLVVHAAETRGPLEHEHRTDRLYLLAERPV